MDILIIKTSALGDIAQAFLVIQYLKEKFPQSNIDWVVEASNAPLLEKHPDIRQVITVNTKTWRKHPLKKNTKNECRLFRKIINQTYYDVVFDLQGNLKSGLISSVVKAKDKVGYGFRSAPEFLNPLFHTTRFDPPKTLNARLELLFLIQSYFQDTRFPKNNPSMLQITEHEEYQLDTLITSNSQKILLCPGAAWRNKRLPTESLIKIAQQLIPLAHLFISWGNDREYVVAQRINSSLQSDSSTILPKLPFHVLQHLIKRMDLVIAMDSFPLHLAEPTQTPTFSLFGPSSALKYHPLSENQKWLQGECPYKIKFDKRCPHLRTCLTGACLRTFDESCVSEEIKKLLSNK
ncbi:MAG: lipopolysaccharide heptosyltransferase I [Chlamydiales bacterium]